MSDRCTSVSLPDLLRCVLFRSHEGIHAARDRGGVWREWYTNAVREVPITLVIDVQEKDGEYFSKIIFGEITLFTSPPCVSADVAHSRATAYLHRVYGITP